MKRCVMLMWVLLALACDFGAPRPQYEGGVTSLIRVADANEVRSRPSERPDRARESERNTSDGRGMRAERSVEVRYGSFRAQRQLPGSFRRSSLYKWEYGEFDGRTLRNSVPESSNIDAIRDHLRTRAELDGKTGERATISVFSDLPTAERATAETLRRNKAEIETWLKQGETERSFYARFEKSVGVTWNAETATFSNADSNTVVLRKTADGRFSVVESYPDLVRRERRQDTISASDSIPTPYGPALQGRDAASIAARAQVERGATLYRIGTAGRSEGAEAQFWSLEHPMTPGYASRHGIPPENVRNANFIEAATLKRGTPFITRPAPAVGSNPGGGIEVVVPSGSVRMRSYAGTP